VGQQALNYTSVRHNRQGDWGNEFGHRRYGDVLLQPGIRRAEPEVQPPNSGDAASAATSGQAPSGNREYESDNGRREDSHGSNASTSDTVNWLDKIIQPHVEREVLRIKAREAVAKLPPPAPMVQGPNVLAQPKIQISQWKVESQKIQKETENKMPLVVMILGVVGQLVDGLISNGMKANWPKDLIDAIVAASSAIGTAHSLAVTKVQLEAARQVASTPTA
jgi:hypothetical protein